MNLLKNQWKETKVERKSDLFVADSRQNSSCGILDQLEHPENKKLQSFFLKVRNKRTFSSLSIQSHLSYLYYFYWRLEL